MRKKREFALVEIQVAKMPQNIPEHRHMDATVHVAVPPVPEFVRRS